MGKIILDLDTYLILIFYWVSKTDNPVISGTPVAPGTDVLVRSTSAARINTLL